MPDLPEILRSGEDARLIPVLADTSKEGRAASIFLASMVAVDDLARAMLGGIGVRVGARTTVRCLTEVSFHKSLPEMRGRPDGLILVTTGKSNWSALVEAKIGKAELEDEQIKNYVQLAKLNGINAVITLSNQFVSLPSHHPVVLPKPLIKGLDLFHWSWMYVLTQATLLLTEDQFSSPDQRYVLKEMVRYFRHPSVGVSSFDRMNAEWKDLVIEIQSGAPLKKTSPEVENSVASWHQEGRDLCLILSRKIGRQTRLKLSRAHTYDQTLRLKDDCEELVQTATLTCVMEVPDAAAPISISADLARRTVTCSMRLAAPEDKKRSSARINWLLRQLAYTDPQDIFVKAIWPGRAQDTQASLSDLRSNPAILETEKSGLRLQYFEVLMVRDLAGKFSGPKTFIENLEACVPYYYEQVGQRLRAWVPPPPKIIEPEAEKEDKGFATEVEGVSGPPNDQEPHSKVAEVPSSVEPRRNEPSDSGLDT